MNHKEREDRLDFIIDALLAEGTSLDQARRPADFEGKKRLFRDLLTVRPARPAAPELLAAQNDFLRAEAQAKGIVEPADLPAAPLDPRLSLWQGDITRLRLGAIVNAANSSLSGCWIPGHFCIDNAIHFQAGLELRLRCREIIQAQGHQEPTGRARLTPGYNLPAAHVLHTVGPVVGGRLNDEHCRLLRSSYQACLELAAETGLDSLAFCCVSTGAFRFPKNEAAAIAVETTRAFLDGARGQGLARVVFNVFGDGDRDIYRELLAV